MTIFDKISENEKDAIAHAIKKCAGAKPSAPLSHILRYWSTEKAWLFHMFGDKLTVSKPVRVKKSPAEMRDEWCTLCEHVFITEIVDKVYPYISLWDLYGMVDDAELEQRKEKNRNHDLFMRLITEENLASNEVPHTAYFENASFPLPEGKTLRVQPGMKVMRVLSKIAAAYNLKSEFEDFRIKHSMILNDMEIETTLYLSIHPLDFITASVNDCSWRSCMHWKDGEFRLGTVEMMNSPCVICAYIKSSEDMSLFKSSYSWNNKRWREFVIVDDDVVCPIKGYPYWNHELEEAVMDFIDELRPNHYSKKTISLDFEDANDYHPSFASIYNDKENRLNFYTDAMYNDFRYTDHRARLSLFMEENPTNIYLNYSGEATCMICGDVIDLKPAEGDDDDYSLDGFNGNAKESGFLYCHECARRYGTVCSCCDEIISVDDDSYDVDGRILCQNCYENETCDCDICGTIHMCDTITEFKPYIIVDDKAYLAYSEYYFGNVCEYCRENSTVITHEDIDYIELKEYSIPERKERIRERIINSRKWLPFIPTSSEEN